MFLRTEDFLPFSSKIWLSSPTMHGTELEYMTEAFNKNWMSTVGENINEVERIASEIIGEKYAVALSSGTAALHFAMKLAGEEIYGKPILGKGSLFGKRVFCSDMTFCATANPIIYEGGIPVFIETERDTWNMDPEALERAFLIYPEVKIIVVAHLYGTPAKMDEIKAVAEKHGAVIIEDAAESLGATYKGKQTGSFGSYNCISYNGNKIISGSAGGMLLTNDKLMADKARKWASQSRESADWYQQEELGYNYRMSNVIAGVIRGQFPYLSEHIKGKKEIYERYKKGFSGLPVRMNPYDEQNSEPNFWLSCLLIDNNAMCMQQRSETKASYIKEHNKSCPTEILEALNKINCEGRPIWKPMHMQPVYRMHSFITKDGSAEKAETFVDGNCNYVGRDIFNRGFCLPSDNKMTAEQQDIIIEVIKSCFE